MLEGESETWAFVDEYGTANLDTSLRDVGKYFIVTAVILDGRVLESTRAGLEVVRKKHFQTGEMKSKKLGKARGRWARVLADLATVPFKFYALAVDKREISRTSGLKWKNSFYKHLCGRLYNKLMRTYRGLNVRADQYGDVRFKETFARYVEANHRPTLFERGGFELVDGRHEVLTQLADLVCGLLARAYDPDKKLDRAHELVGILKDHAMVIDEWPPRYGVTLGRTDLVLGDDIDERISTFALRQAEHFIQKNGEAKDLELRAQVAVLERLSLERRFGAGQGYVSTSELMDLLRQRGLEPKSNAWLRMAVIARLRDRQVLVTSSPSGYNLPASRGHLDAFVRHAETTCIPMLNRVEAACGAVKLATRGEIDILDDPSHAELRGLLQAHQEWRNRPPG